MFALLLGALGPANAAVAGANPNAPAILAQPASLVARESEVALLSVTASGAEPLAYQWFANNVTITNATNATLTLAGLTLADAAAYTASVSNNAGTVTSLPAVLKVRPLTPRQLRVDGATQAAGGQVRLPIQFDAQGDETNVQTSIEFEPAVLQYQGVQPGADAAPLTATVDPSLLAQGRLGLTWRSPAGTNFTAQRWHLAEVVFGLAAGQSVAGARLALGDLPVPTQATGPDPTGTNGVQRTLDAMVAPMVAASPTPALNPQSGLLNQRVTVVNHGRYAANGIWVYVLDVTNLVAGLPIRVENAQRDDLGTPYVQTGLLAQGASIDYTIEFYVADRRTLPQPRYRSDMVALAAFSLSGTAIPVDRAWFTNGVFLVEFLTAATYPYYIEYADDVNQESWYLALPPATGNGGRVQWIDNGPPKTHSVPLSQTNRFYRVTRVP